MNPVLVSCWGRPKKYFDAFGRTSERHGMTPYNADPNDWGGDDWRTIEWFRKSEAQAKFVREHAEQYSHFMFTDSYDVVFAAGWDEILPKFLALDSPIVFAAECFPWPKEAQAKLYPDTSHRCKYLNAGFWMGEAKAALAMLEDLAVVAAKREQCDQGIAVDMFLSRRHPIVLDTACSLCFCMNLDSANFLNLEGVRPKTTDTLQQPCMFHGNGGSDLSGVIACLDKV
jgi:hypothetical protein